MKISTLEKQKPFLEDGLLQSLYYLYQEILKENLQELAYIVEVAICDCEEAIRKNFIVSEVGESIFTQFHFLRGFRQLNKEQREVLVRKIVLDQTKH